MCKAANGFISSAVMSAKGSTFLVKHMSAETIT